MKKSDRGALRRYYRSISSWLPCPRKLKNMVLSNIRENVEDFIDENPMAGIGQVRTRFGTPQELAASYVMDLPISKVLKKLRVRRQIMTAVIAALLVALLLWGIGVGFSMWDQYSIMHGYHYFP